MYTSGERTQHKNNTIETSVEQMTKIKKIDRTISGKKDNPLKLQRLQHIKKQKKLETTIKR